MVLLSEAQIGTRMSGSAEPIGRYQPRDLSISGDNGYGAKTLWFRDISKLCTVFVDIG